MPGLLRGVARTAVVAGTATAVSNRVSRRQAGRWAAQDQQDAPPPNSQPPRYEEQPYEAPVAAEPAADPMSDKLEHLEKLGELKAQGVLTQEEFEEQKHRLLG
jgi:hypothetical protein